MAHPITTISFQGYQFVGAQTTVANMTAAVGIALPTNANAFLLQATGQNVRITLDGQPPTAGHGFQIRAGDPPVLIVFPTYGNGSLQAIQETSGAFLEVIGVSQPI